MKFVGGFLCFCLVGFHLNAEEPSDRSSWPNSETNQYEIIGNKDIGILIPLPDFEFVFDTRNDEHQFYLHKIYPRRALGVRIEGFDEPKTPKEYGDISTGSWKQDVPLIEMIEDKEIIAGSTRSIPMLRRTWKNERVTIHQLYFIRGKVGVCLTAFCDPPTEIPDEIVEQENQYWEKLFEELAQAVDFSGEQANISVEG